MIELKYQPILSSFASRPEHILCGTPEGESSKYWSGSMISGAGDYVKEGMVAIDYGCGNARCGNYLSGCLKDFLYVGLEPDTPHGNQCLAYDRETYKDPRFVFGHCDSSLEAEMLGKASVVYLGSVFTHTLIEDTYRILDKFLPLINRGGTVVFSYIAATIYAFIGPNTYDIEKGFGIVYNLPSQYFEYAKNNGLRYEQYGVCTKLSGPAHQIARFVKEKINVNL